MTSLEESPAASAEGTRGPREVPLRIGVLSIAILISVGTGFVTWLDFAPVHPTHMSPLLSACWSVTVLTWIWFFFFAHSVIERRRATQNKRTRRKVGELEDRLRRVEATLEARGRAIMMLEERAGLPRGAIDAMAQEQMRNPDQDEPGDTQGQEG